MIRDRLTGLEASRRRAGRRGGVAMTERTTATIGDRSTTDQADVITVFLADGHRVVREGLAAYLGLIDDIAVVGEAVDGQDAVDRITAMARGGELPQVVLISLLMPVMDGLVATRMIKRLWPHVGVIALTSLVEHSMVTEVLAAGAAGYLVKEVAEADDVARAVRSTADAGRRRHRGDLQIGVGSLTRAVRQVGPHGFAGQCRGGPDSSERPLLALAGSRMPAG
jgi:DNA-binding NarL/FixJ family response regulator